MVRKKGNQNDPGGGFSPNDRTAPAWLDTQGEHGPLSILLMVPANPDHKLPTNPFTIARSVKEQVGSIAAAYRDKDGHLVMKVRSEKKVAKLLELTELIDGTAVRIMEHARLNQARCIVTCHSVSELSEEELTKELADQGVIGVHRLGRKGGKSATMVVTFRGTVVPNAIHFGYDICSTRTYKQAPMQCYRCFSYGHTKARCTAEAELCRNCSKAHTISKDQDGKTICEAAASCKNCGGAHSPASRACAKFLEEETINEIRTSEDKSAREARRIFEERKAAAEGGTSYAAVTGSGNSDARLNQGIQKELAETKQMLQKAMGELTKLKEAGAEAKTAQKEHELTKRNLTRALNELAKLKAAASKPKPKPSTEPAQEWETESEGEMDVDPLNIKRRRQSDEDSGEDSSASTNNEHQSDLIDLTDAQESTQVTPDEATSDPPQWKVKPNAETNKPKPKPKKKTNDNKQKKSRTESGDSPLPPSNNKKNKKQ